MQLGQHLTKAQLTLSAADSQSFSSLAQREP